MPTESLWNSLEVAKLVVLALVPLTVGLLGIWINQRLKKLEWERQEGLEEQRREREEAGLRAQQEREENQRQYQEKREIERIETERIYTPHIQFDLGCQFFGPRQGKFLVNFLLRAENRGRVIHRFPSILLQVRGIRSEESFEYWDDEMPRARFPHKILEAEVVPRKWNFVFVEPSVTQQITYATIISEDYSMIQVKAEFHYDSFTPHTVESVFAVPGTRGLTGG